MSRYPVYYQGSSIALIFRLKSKDTGTPVKLEEYEAEATVYTRLLGKKIESSTCDPDKISVYRITDYQLAVNIPGSETAQLPAGECNVQLRLTHKETGAVVITTKKVLLIEETV